jgi:hypothetical protein
MSQFLDAKTAATQRPVIQQSDKPHRDQHRLRRCHRKGDIWPCVSTHRDRGTTLHEYDADRPSVLYPTDNTLLIGRCAASLQVRRNRIYAYRHRLVCGNTGPTSVRTPS